jgi:hypothetical protein
MPTKAPIKTQAIRGMSFIAALFFSLVLPRSAILEVKNGLPAEWAAIMAAGSLLAAILIVLGTVYLTESRESRE